MKQKVHSVSYLAKAEFEFKTGVYDLVALPAGAEVVKMSLELVGGAPNAGAIDMSVKDESKNILLTLLSASNTDFPHGSTTKTINKDYTATSNNVVVVSLENANEDHIKGVLRVLYFLPSTIEVEY